MNSNNKLAYLKFLKYGRAITCFADGLYINKQQQYRELSMTKIRIHQV